ncbi:unnamed protein product [Diamesa serratosioi]
MEIEQNNEILEDPADLQKQFDDSDDDLIQKLKNGELNIEQIAKDLEKLYKDELLEYAEKSCPTNEEIFAQSFSNVIHSCSLQDILVKEQEYAKEISEMVIKMEKSVKRLNDQHQEEMDKKINLMDKGGATSEDVNKLLSTQYAAQNLLRKKNESELEAKRGHQKNQYREFITTEVGQNLLTDTPSPVIGHKSSMFMSQKPFIMEESFTIFLGSQLKQMFNIRILSAEITEALCSPLVNEHDDCLGGNIQLGIYSNSLCGTVVLTPLGSCNVSANQKIVRNSNLSTEFHFEQIDEQLEKIQEDLKQTIDAGENASRRNLKAGDFFITKHSNLSGSHLIFHLVSEEPHEMNSRNPEILGLRNILKVASRYDCQQLTIPALLRHEMTEEMTVGWCVRRAELIFKCTKGFMIESSAWSGTDLLTLQLLLPHNISEDLFLNISSMVPNIFRVANTKFL